MINIGINLTGKVDMKKLFVEEKVRVYCVAGRGASVSFGCQGVKLSLFSLIKIRLQNEDELVPQ